MGTPRLARRRWLSTATLLFGMLVTAPLCAATPQVGDRAPEWNLRNLDGERVRFPRDVGDRPALVMFWATWCPYCKALMPRLATLKEEHAGQGLEVYAIAFGESGDPSAAMRAMGLPLVIFPKGDAVARRYDITKVPAVFLVRNGVITYRLDYPPPEHPASRARHGKEQAALLGEWWEARIGEALAGT